MSGNSLQAKESQRTRCGSAARTCTLYTARSFVRLTTFNEQSDATRSGVCYDPDDAVAWDEVKRCLAAWK